MLAAGIELMVIGMGTVFAFLSLMVLMMHASAKAVATFAPPAAAIAQADTAQTNTAQTDNNAEIAAVLAIVAAARRAANNGRG